MSSPLYVPQEMAYDEFMDLFVPGSDMTPRELKKIGQWKGLDTNDPQEDWSLNPLMVCTVCTHTAAHADNLNKHTVPVSEYRVTTGKVSMAIQGYFGLAR